MAPKLRVIANEHYKDPNTDSVSYRDLFRLQALAKCGRVPTDDNTDVNRISAVSEQSASVIALESIQFVRDLVVRTSSDLKSLQKNIDYLEELELFIHESILNLEKDIWTISIEDVLEVFKSLKNRSFDGQKQVLSEYLDILKDTEDKLKKVGTLQQSTTVVTQSPQSNIFNTGSLWPRFSYTP
ncbi:MAG: hypothetical protein KAJ86_04325 [Alphaproteobacteria bacterium]|nr:hypothetical protein [Alphaproteobacteria bacterium]